MPTEQHDQHFLHKRDTFPLDTKRIPRRWCSLQAASGKPHPDRVQTFTTPYKGHVMTSCLTLRISGILPFSEASNGLMRHVTQVISYPRWLGLPLPRLHKAYPFTNTSHRIFHASSGHDFMCRLADLQFPTLKP